MEYNTTKEHLIIPEYGRNIQHMIEYGKKIEDDNQRQLFANYIVDLMLQMATSSRNNNEFRDKMWVHFFKIAQYDIDVVPPNGIVPSKEEAGLKPVRVEYPNNNSAFRHYGQFVQKMIAKAIEMEEGPKKEEFKNLIASYMKLAFKNWSREHYVNDESIKSELKNMSKGKLTLDDDVVLNKIRAANKVHNPNQRSHRSKRSGGRDNKRDNKRYKRKR